MYLDGRNIKLSTNPTENLLELEGEYYQIDFLHETNKYVHGGNGIIFKLSDEQKGIDYVIKFLRFSVEYANNDWKLKKRLKRFDREVEALYVAKTNSLLGIVQIETHGDFIISGETFPYYIMEKCDFTLNQYLQDEGDDLNVIQKTMLCHKILEGVQQLHEYKIYHRDIKHDNIYFLDGEPLIGDLGLVDFQDTDYIINENGELIGPTGWFSPEALNKYLVEKTPNKNKFDCTIDEKSEVFQLGKLFWYIFQGNLPIGQIQVEDFLPNNEIIYEILYNMLVYSKNKRSDTEKVSYQIGSFLSSN
ncbi:hypothetical protein ADIARSV_2794 [Arcticibacter svalbardensis MN12-7]|uniref:Protein kinase domain-containing protein n=1 Tax=Arcticibacter svalbardensis MN12-7 TaxID=1150600 RepID=R9GQY0_9SPHI|nr:protein kinase [Arcticibacter svalbardensis]EOR93960.1 hypothetical protein ADIARSV_2794 [Arcticibacter svalbardensis MN12-7]